MSSWGPGTDFVFHMPTKVLFGAGSHREIGAEVGDLGCSRPLIVTDRPLFDQTDIPAKVQKALGSACVGVFADVQPDSLMEAVDAAAEFAKQKGADCLVSVGGGSCIDTAKAMSIVMTCGGSIRDHLAVNALPGPQTPHVAVPTTAGTGSEVTNAALVKDASSRTKFFVLDTYLFPRTAVLDASLTTGLPPGLTAATGMDAATHAVEAITSVCRNPASQGFAVEALGMISGSLKQAVDSPDDLASRGTMLSAAMLAGAAFCNAMVGLVHAVSHALGGLCSVHHGLANSIMLPHVIRFNSRTHEELYAPMVEALDLASAEECADALSQLAASCGLETRLSQVGVQRAQFNQIADRTISDGAIINNCRPVAGTDEIIELLEQAF